MHLRTRKKIYNLSSVVREKKKEKNIIKPTKTPKYLNLGVSIFLDKTFEKNKYSLPLSVLYLRKGMTEVHSHIALKHIRIHIITMSEYL